MLVTQPITYRTAIFIDEAFLNKIQSRFEEFKVYALNFVAEDTGIDQHDIIMHLDNESDNYLIRNAVSRYKSLSKIRYDAEWENDKSVRSVSLAELKDALDYETANPRRLIVEIGDYTNFRISLNIEHSQISTGKLTARAEMRDLPLICENIGNIIQKSSPDFGFFYHSITVATMPFIAIIGMNVIFWAKASEKPSLAQMTSPASIFLGAVFAAFCFVAGHFYAKGFRPVLFEYGKYSRSKSIANSIFWMLSTIAIPYALSKIQ